MLHHYQVTLGYKFFFLSKIIYILSATWRVDAEVRHLFIDRDRTIIYIS
jgi:hypothetical protein